MIEPLIRKCLFPLARAYWRTFRPRTFGVKGVVPRPNDDRQVLLIRNTYGDLALWNLAGGGYRPKREAPENAIAREIREELSLTTYKTERLGEYRTNAEGKRDTVTIFLCRITSDHVNANSEIAKVRWVSVEDLERLRNIARVALHGIELYTQSLNQQQGDCQR